MFKSHRLFLKGIRLISFTYFNFYTLKFFLLLQQIKEETFRAKEDTLIITCIAELHLRKGQKYLIKAIPEIISKYPNVKFVFVGKGKEMHNYQALIDKLHIKKNAILIGQKNNIPQILKSSDIFILPSIREAFGLVNIEAMMTKLPVIATKVGGIPEIVKNYETGIQVDPKNTEQLTKATLILIESPQIRREMAEKGFQRVLNNFDAKIMAEKYEKIYDSYCK